MPALAIRTSRRLKRKFGWLTATPLLDGKQYFAEVVCVPYRRQSNKGPSPRFALRARTAAAHQRVDNLFSGLNLPDLDDYQQFLAAQAAAFIPVEEALVGQGIEAHLPGYGANRRSSLLLQDLTELAITVPQPLCAPSFASKAALLGAAYVLEGSRLGGALLRKQVPVAFPTRFLAAPTTLKWPAFIDALDRLLVTDAQVDAAVSAAQAVFALFETSALNVRGH